MQKRFTHPYKNVFFLYAYKHEPASIGAAIKRAFFITF
jgi:hypothetical protein